MFFHSMVFDLSHHQNIDKFDKIFVSVYKRKISNSPWKHKGSAGP